MTCEHLQAVEQAIIAQGIRKTYRGQAWSSNCREWVYFDCYIDTAAVRQAFTLPGCVEDHVHRVTHDGQERGFACSKCHDGIMGTFDPKPASPVFRG